MDYLKGPSENRDEDTDQIAENVSETSAEISYMSLIKESLIMAFALGISGLILYLPFYIGFSSQAGGILPNIVFSTRGTHLWIMFGALLLPIFAYLIYLRKHVRDQFYLGKGFLLALGLMLILWIVSLLFGLGIASIPLIGDVFVNSIGGEPSNGLLEQIVLRRISGLGWVTLLLILSLTLGYLVARIKSMRKAQPQSTVSSEAKGSQVNEPSNIRSPSTHDFVLLLIFMGSLLVLFTEFFYLRDQFGSRMNTIFKFYFQAWILWGLAAAFGTAILLKKLRRFWGIAFRIGLAILLLAAFVYPLLSLWNKTNGFNPTSGFTLDGTAYYELSAPEEMAAIHWLENAPPGVVIEAVGPQYSEFARVATMSGQPNVLGWAGHESQWRGGREEIGSREEDVALIYQTNNWEDAKGLLDLYNVRYIFIGSIERRTYRVDESKFERYLGEPVYKSGDISIYEIPREIRISSID